MNLVLPSRPEESNRDERERPHNRPPGHEIEQERKTPPPRKRPPQPRSGNQQS